MHIPGEDGGGWVFYNGSGVFYSNSHDSGFVDQDDGEEHNASDYHSWATFFIAPGQKHRRRRARPGFEDLDVALDAANILVTLNPTSLDPLLARGAVFIRRGEWEKAEADCRAALAIHPLLPRAHLQLAVCLHHRENPDAGRKEANTALSLTTSPRQRSALQDWYENQTR